MPAEKCPAEKPKLMNCRRLVADGQKIGPLSPTIEDLQKYLWSWWQKMLRGGGNKVASNGQECWEIYLNQYREHNYKSQTSQPNDAGRNPDRISIGGWINTPIWLVDWWDNNWFFCVSKMAIKSILSLCFSLCHFRSPTFPECSAAITEVVKHWI